MRVQLDSRTIARHLKQNMFPILMKKKRIRHSPGVLVKYIERTNPLNDIVKDESSELSQVPEREEFLGKGKS